MELFIITFIVWALGVVTGLGVGVAVGSERMRQEMLRDWLD